MEHLDKDTMEFTPMSATEAARGLLKIVGQSVRNKLRVNSSPEFVSDGYIDIADNEIGILSETDELVRVNLDQVAGLFESTGVPQKESSTVENRDAARIALDMALDSATSQEDETKDVVLLHALVDAIYGERNEEGLNRFSQNIEGLRIDKELVSFDYGMDDRSVVKAMLNVPDGAMTYRNAFNVWHSRMNIPKEWNHNYSDYVWFTQTASPKNMGSKSAMGISLDTAKMSKSINGLTKIASLSHYVMNHPILPESDVVTRGEDGECKIVYDLTDQLYLAIEFGAQIGRVTALIESKQLSGSYGENEDNDAFLEFATEQQLVAMKELFPKIMQDVFRIIGEPSLPSFEVTPIINNIDQLPDGAIEPIYGVERDQLDVPIALSTEDEIQMYKELVVPHPEHTFDMIAGLEEQVREIKDVANSLKFGARMKRAGSTSQARLLLVGEKGAGKKMFAEAVANYLGGPLLLVTSKDMGSKYVNEGERNISLIFKVARLLGTPEKPCVAFFDEIDSSTTQRSSTNAHDSQKQATGQMLTELSSKQPNVLVLAAGNQPEEIDDALIRPGRFNSYVKIPLPDFETKKLIFEKRIQHHVSISEGLPIASDIDFGALATRAESLKLGGDGISTAIDLAIIAGELENEENGIEEIATLTNDRITEAMNKIVRDREKEKTLKGFSRALDK